jgi:hypothetical protein
MMSGTVFAQEDEAVAAPKPPAHRKGDMNLGLTIGIDLNIADIPPNNNGAALGYGAEAADVMKKGGKGNDNKLVAGLTFDYYLLDWLPLTGGLLFQTNAGGGIGYDVIESSIAGSLTEVHFWPKVYSLQIPVSAHVNWWRLYTGAGLAVDIPVAAEIEGFKDANDNVIDSDTGFKALPNVAVFADLGFD